MNKYVRIIAVAAPFMVLQLFSEDRVVLMNNTIYTIDAEFSFKCGDASENQKCKQVRSIPFGKSVGVAFPQVKGGSSYGARSYKNAFLGSIKVTVPALREPIWADGKVGSKVTGMKITREEKSVLFTPGSNRGQTNRESATFVVNANRAHRSPLLIKKRIPPVENLAVYRFIQ